MKSKFMLTLILLFSLSAISQNKDQANQIQNEANKEVTATIQKLISTLNGLFINNPDRSIASLTGMLEPDYEMSTFLVDVGGNARRSHIPLSDYKTQMINYLNFDGLKIIVDLVNINYIKAYENFATASITIDQKYILKEEVLIKSKTFVNLYLRKTNGVWKIWESSTANIVKEQTLGICPCEYIKTGEGESKYMSRLMVPNGSDFVSTTLNFEINPIGDIKVIKVSNNTYSWDSNNRITCVKKGEETVTEPLDGTPTTTYEAMNLIILKHIYKSNCIGLRSQVKK